ncbi:MAG: hypothetical protein ABI605_21055 [Rhizobacter sp.]
MAQEQYRAIGGSTTTPTALKQRKEIRIPEARTDYTLFYHYGDLDQTPVGNATFLVTLSNGETRQGTLDGFGRAQLCGVPKGPVSVEYQYDTPEADDPAIIEARDKIRKALDEIVAQTRLDMADEWKEWNEAGWMKRQYLLKINEWQGQAVGAWEWLSGTVETVWQLAVLLYKTDREVREVCNLILTGQWHALDKKIASYRAKGEKVLDAAGQVKELLILIFHDEKTRDLIQAFSSNWWAAIPPDERRELEASVGTQIAIDVIIAVLLAAFSAGTAGAAYGSAKWTERIGKLGSKVIRLLDKLEEAFKDFAKALKLRKRKMTALEQRANATRVIETKWRPKPGSLSNKEAREWYLKQEAEIPSKIDKSQPLEGQAKQAFELRNEARTGARESMSDRELAAKLNLEEPNMTREQTQQKYGARGYKGDDLWNAIIDGSQKSRASVNSSLGIKPPGSP